MEFRRQDRPVGRIVLVVSRQDRPCCQDRPCYQDRDGISWNLVL